VTLPFRGTLTLSAPDGDGTFTYDEAAHNHSLVLDHSTPFKWLRSPAPRTCSRVPGAV